MKTAEQIAQERYPVKMMHLAGAGYVDVNHIHRGEFEAAYSEGYNADKWIPVEEELPEKEQCVIILCEREKYGGGKVQFQTVACYIPRMSVKEEDFMDEQFQGEGDYNEELEEYFTPEGWYEAYTEPDINYKISSTVIAWQPLPSPPKQNNQVNH